MTRVVCVASVLIAAALSYTGIEAQAQSLSKLLEDARAAGSLPAIAAARFSSAGTVEAAAVGVRKLGDNTAVTTEDLWHIGSITKSFTAMLVARLVERGDLSWTTSLKDLFGDDAGAYGGVTVSHLLGHRAGLPANATPAMLNAPGASAIVVDIRRRVTLAALKTTPSWPAGTEFLYSNLGYTVLASAIETRTGRAWEELLQAEVLTPLGLSSAGHGAPGVLNQVTQPRGHRGGKTPVEPGPFADNPPYMGPAGRLHMTIGDLARWGQAHLRGERGQDGIVTAATFARMHAPLAVDGQYGMGWVSVAKPEPRLVWHNGSNTMWYAVVAFVPEKDRGIAVVSNGGIEAQAVVEKFVQSVLR